MTLTLATPEKAEDTFGGSAMAKVVIERMNGKWENAIYVGHVRTLTGGNRNDEVDLYRLEDGSEIECISPANDSRARPVECDPNSDHYPGHRPGE